MKGKMGWGVIGFVILTLTACGGGGGGGGSDQGGGDDPIVGLEIPDHISIVEAKDVSTPSAMLVKALTPDPSTPYFTDPLDVYVFDDSMESLGTINNILCMINQTRYIEMVNQGNYIALVDEKACSRAMNQASSSGGVPNEGTPDELMYWIINSSRADSASPHIVEAWIKEEGGGYDEPKIIHARAVIDEPVSDAKPFGDFRLDFEMWDETEVIRWEQGYLRTVEQDRAEGREGIMFSMAGVPPLTHKEGAHVVLDTAAKTGQAYTSRKSNDGGRLQTRTYRVAFDDDLYRARSTRGTERCLDREHFDLMSTRYGLYQEDGSRLELAYPAFEIKYGDYYGTAGYWGIWLPREVSLKSGMEVVRRGPSAVTGEVYRTFVAPGKLMRHAHHQISLADIEGDFLNYWAWPEGKTYRVVWDGSEFIQTHLQQCERNGPCWWEEVESTALELAPFSWINFWRDGMGSITLVVPEDGVNSATPVTYDESITLNTAAAEFSGGAALTLKCYTQCPKPHLTAAMLRWSGEDPYFPPAQGPGSPYLYTIDPTDMTLRFEGRVVAPVAGASGNDDWDYGGINSGAMVPAAVTPNNIWDVWQEGRYYTWETGLNEWNKYSGLIDAAGVGVLFDPPILLDYLHSDGVKYVLQYAGFGELFNIPWVEDPESGRWHPTISVPDGIPLRADGGAIYYPRALSMEQRMHLLPSTRCSALTLGNVTPPDSNYVDTGLGPMPSASGDPSVIRGELVTP